jgi:large subunit ribosomal protein L17
LALIELVLEPVNPKAVTKKPKLENAVKATAGTATAVSEPVEELSVASETVEAAAEVAAEAPVVEAAQVEEVAAAEEAAGTEETPEA